MEVRNAHWSTSELCGMLGIGRETLRYYEREGLVKPARTDNGYRTYTYDDYLLLLDIVEFRSSGMSVEQIKSFLTSNSIQENREFFRTCASRERELVQRHRRLLEQFEQVDEIYRLIEMHVGRNGIRPFERQYPVSAQLFAEEGRCGCFFEISRYDLAAGKAGLVSGGVFVSQSDALRLGLLARCEESGIIESCLCAYTIVCAKGRLLRPTDVEEVYAWALAHGFSPNGQAYSRYLAASASEYYVEAWLPLDEGDR